MSSLRTLENRLGIEFDDNSLLSRAITHRSFLNENPNEVLEDNERLEFLGDAVLDFVVASYLYHRFPEMDEGDLTMLRAALVRTGTLAGFAEQLEIGEVLKLGYGEAESGGRNRPANLCAAFEAIVGAIYLDQGLDNVRQWVEPLIAPALEEIIADSTHKDAKSEFQIWSQGRYNVTPRYRVLGSEGPDHNKTFTVAAMLGAETWGIGRGSSKQAAAQVAAGMALKKTVGIVNDEQSSKIEAVKADT